MGIVAQIRDPCLDTGSCADLSVIAELMYLRFTFLHAYLSTRSSWSRPFSCQQHASNWDLSLLGDCSST